MIKLKVKGFSKTKCMDNIAFFKKQIFCKFWETVLDSINDPAQHEVASIKCGSNVKKEMVIKVGESNNI